MGTALVVLASLVALAFGMGLLARRIRQARLPRPSMSVAPFGVRTLSTLKSDAAWTASHRAIRPLLLFAASISAVGAAITVVLLVARHIVAAVNVVTVSSCAVVVISLAMIVQAHVVASRVPAASNR